MEARTFRATLFVACLASLGASHRTQNFIVSAPNAQLCQEIGETAERLRSQLALEWLGRELPPWRAPCPIEVQAGRHLGAGGQTSFSFDGGGPFGWSMSIQGSRERLLDSVLPHEITHTIFATHFRQPLPRWADEGACTTVEHASERANQQRMLIEFLTTGRGIPFNSLFAMREYPRDILPLYSQGFSLARFLIGQGGKQKFVEYVGDGLQSNDWTRSTRQHYGYANLSELQVTWLDWVRSGSREPVAETFVAQQEQPSAHGGNSPRPLRLASNTHTNAEDGPSSSLVSKASVEGNGWYARIRDEQNPASPGMGNPRVAEQPRSEPTLVAPIRTPVSASAAASASPPARLVPLRPEYITADSNRGMIRR